MEVLNLEIFERGIFRRLRFKDYVDPFDYLHGCHSLLTNYSSFVFFVFCLFLARKLFLIWLITLYKTFTNFNMILLNFFSQQSPNLITFSVHNLFISFNLLFLGNLFLSCFQMPRKKKIYNH